jgi:flagellar biosynthesis protein FlhG
MRAREAEPTLRQDVPDQAAKLRARRETRPSWSVAVTSGKGGVGKTSLAVNLGLALARAGRRTCLLDGDLGLANVDVMLNLHPAASLRDVILDDRPLQDAVLDGPDGLRVIPAASGIEALANLSPGRRRALSQRLEGLATLAECTIFDTGAGLSETVLTLTLAADIVLIVTTPDPTALTDAYAMVKVLTQRRPRLSLRLVVNLAETAGQAQEIHGHLDRIVRRFLGRSIPAAGWIPRDGCVERAVREQRPLMLYYPYARATDAIRSIARDLEGPPAGPAEIGYWNRLCASGESA